MQTIFTVYIAMTIYYTIQNIKQSIKNKTIDEDLERKWKQLNDNLYYVKMTILRKEYNKSIKNLNDKDESN